MSESEHEQRHLDRYGMIFRDSRMNLIDIDEEISLRDAINKLDQAVVAYKEAWHIEMSICGGPEIYHEMKDRTDQARREKEAAKANAMAAMFRDTGYWPYQIYELGLR